jgi:hypothetical protein
MGKRLLIVFAVLLSFLFAGCKISGVATDDGQPLAGVIITLTGPAGTKTASTNAEGKFAFSMLKAGTYSLRADKTGLLFTPETQSATLASTDFAGVSGLYFEARPEKPKALVIINSTSTGYGSYLAKIKPALASFSANFTTTELNIANTEVAGLNAYDVIIIGHNKIDIGNVYMNDSEQQLISQAVTGGKGFINFDNDLAEETLGTPINFSCVDNANQDPVVTLAGRNTIVNPDDSIVIDNMWSEYAYNRPFTTLLANTLEQLPTMRLHKSVPNGQYKVYAKLYTVRDRCRYYFGFSESDPMSQWVDTRPGLAGEEYEHNWFFLDNASVNKGEFNLYTKNAQYENPLEYFFGWAELKLVPVTLKPRYSFVGEIFKFGYTPAASELNIEFKSGKLLWCSDNAVQDPDVTVMTILENDNKWSEFAHKRPFATVMGHSNEFLPDMKFSKSGLEPGVYDVFANVYTNHADTVYKYGFTASTITNSSFTAVKQGPNQILEHTEYKLGSIELSDGVFNLFVKDADVNTPTGYYYGWAWVRLAQVDGSVHPVIANRKQAEVIFTVSGVDYIPMSIAGISIPSNATLDVLATTTTGSRKPVIVATRDEETGLVNAVQFGTYDFIGMPGIAINDVIKNSVIWSAQ